MPKRKIVTISGRKFEVLNESRISARVFEALAARSSSILEAMDRARLESLDKEGEFKPSPPAYKHTIFLGSDENGKMLRASISAFANQVIIQTLREV